MSNTVREKNDFNNTNTPKVDDNLLLVGQLTKALSQDKQAKYFIWLLRHGATAANIEGDGRKEADEPLAKSEFGAESTVKKQAKNFLNLGLDIHDLCIHFDPYTIRDIQTAQLFCEEVGLPFPDENEIVDNTSLQQKYPYIVLTKEVATRTKWSIEGNEIPIVWLESNDKGAESMQRSRIRVVDYVQKIQKDIKNKQSAFKHHLLIGHRTGTNWFLDAKYNRSKQDLVNDKSESNVSQLDYWLLDAHGEFINQESKHYGKQWEIRKHNEDRVFEFNISKYPKQVEDFKNTIPNLNILSGQNIINDTNIINAYLDGVKSYLALNKVEEGKEDIELKKEKIEEYLNGKSDLLKYYTLIFLIDAIGISEKNLERKTAFEDIFLEYITKNRDTLSEGEICKLFKRVYKNKDNNMWRYTLKILHDGNANILANEILAEIMEWERRKNKPVNDGRLISKTDIEQEIEKIRYRDKFRDITVNSLVGNVKLKDIYVPQTVSDAEQNTFNIDDFIVHMMTSNDVCSTIQSWWWWWKTMLSNYMQSKLSDIEFLQTNNLNGIISKKIDLDDFEIHDIFIDNFLQDIPQKESVVLIFDGLDEKDPNKVKQLQGLINSDHSGTKYLLLGRYFENSRYEWGTSVSRAYTINMDNDVEKFIEVYKKLIPKRQEKLYVELVNKIQNQLLWKISPLLIWMITVLVDNVLIRRKLANWKISRSDIYDAFLEEYLIREEKKDNSNTGDEIFYDIAYNEAKKILLKTFIECQIKQKNPMYHTEFKLKKKSMQYDVLFHKQSISDYEYTDFMRLFIHNLWEENKWNFTHVYTPPSGIKTSMDGQEIIDVKVFDDFLSHMVKIGFIKQDSSWYLFGLNNIHQSFYDYIWYDRVKNRSFNEYFQKLLGIIRQAGKDLNSIHEKGFENEMWFDDIFYVKQNREFYDFLPKDIKDKVDNFTYWDDDKETTDREKILLEEINKYYPEFLRYSTRILKNIQDYLTFRFFDSKKELIPLLELIGNTEEINSILGEDFSLIMSNFLTETVGGGMVDYDFFTECDHIDEAKQKYIILREKSISFLKWDENQYQTIIDRAIEETKKADDMLLNYELTVFLDGESPPMSREYKHLLEAFKPLGGKPVASIALSEIEKNHLFHLIQLREIKNRWWSKAQYISFQESQYKRASIYKLEAEYLWDFNHLYSLSHYVSEKENEKKYISELDSIRSNITRACQWEKIIGSLYEDIMTTTKKYWLDIAAKRKYEELPGWFFYTLTGSKIELLTNKYLGFA